MKAVDVTSWDREQRADGTIVLTARPAHPGFARERHVQIQIRRGQPIARIGGKRFVTQSGEYGTLAVEHITVDDTPYLRVVGSVIGDGEMMTVEGLAESPNLIALVRDLIVECAWLGASDRIRMVPYRLPAGWFGVRRDLATYWLPPGAPRDPAVLVVGDAVPRGSAERTHAGLWPLEPPADAVQEALDGTALHCTTSTWTRDGRLHATAELVDATWFMRVGLQGGTEQHLIALRDLARSIEVPPARMTTAPASSDLHRWM